MINKKYAFFLLATSISISFNASASGPPGTVFKELSLYSHNGGGDYAGFSNGKFQHELIVNYELAKEFSDYRVKFTLREKKGDVMVELPSYMRQSELENNFRGEPYSHYIDGRAVRSESRVARAGLKEKTLYLSSTKNDKALVCVEALVLDDKNNVIQSQDTCGAGINHGSVSVSYIEPKIYHGKDFEYGRHREFRNDGYMHAELYELRNVNSSDPTKFIGYKADVAPMNPDAWDDALDIGGTKGTYGSQPLVYYSAWKHTPTISGVWIADKWESNSYVYSYALGDGARMDWYSEIPNIAEWIKEGESNVGGFALYWYKIVDIKHAPGKAGQFFSGNHLCLFGLVITCSHPTTPSGRYVYYFNSDSDRDPNKEYGKITLIDEYGTEHNLDFKLSYGDAHGPIDMLQP